ncbi:MAG: hypothetical protein UR68_C0045G0004 [Candidatus Roizmanbacteria bacterium GW2011_GWA2_35_19]|uniref:Cell division protein FtsX n=1 Tax=Candidatus Roizmanbacteria bacterium GW2011_GWA2_35_19 TaxID=1618478 RepID=A0A0G0E435_9BACT|nr:MAG: hypothetical protein UR68_C0045G0004 [Candidatus Roizmanbacteria bacterium GW2011_GWA2_35_19]
MKDVMTSIKRTPYQSITAFMVLFLTLFLSLIIFVSLGFLNGILGYMETRPQVTVYFQTKTPENDIFKIRDELANSDKVFSIKYISQKEAYDIYRDLNKDNPLLLEMVTSDILPSSLEIYAKKPIFLPEIAEFLKKQGGVDEVQFQKDIVDKLLSLTGILRKGGLIFFFYLLFMSVIVLTTTTLFKIALKKDEIELLRLIGANNSYIRRPYLKEGVFLGTAASIMSFLIVLGTFMYAQPFMSSYLSGINKLSLSLPYFEFQVWPLNPIFFAIMFLFTFTFAIIVTVSSSLLATNKYLKV